MEFGIYINLGDVSELDQVKAFVKEFYADLDFINENVDSSSNHKSVCVDCLGVNGFDIPWVSDTIFTGEFAQALAMKEFHIVSMSMNLENLGMAIADFNGNHMDYCASPYYDEGFPVLEVTGSAAEGFQVKELPYSAATFKKVDTRFSYIMADTM